MRVLLASGQVFALNFDYKTVRIFLFYGLEIFSYYLQGFVHGYHIFLNLSRRKNCRLVT